MKAGDMDAQRDAFARFNANRFREFPPRKHHGCAGCLGSVVLALLFGLALSFVLCLVLAPWNFYFGGHFHVIPGWSGRGRIHSTAAGGDYEMRVTFEPTIPGYRKSPIKGTAYLCTPRGERFSLKFYGDMPRSHGTDLRGIPISLSLFNQSLTAQFNADRRPRITLNGTFGNSELVMEDRGSLAKAFRPNGTLYGPHDRDRPKQTEDVHVTFQETSPWDLSRGCPAKTD